MNETNPVELFNIAGNRMLSALSAYHIWKWLSQSINTNNPVGSEVVKRNLEIINKYCFNQIMISSYKSFVVDLFVFFDRGNYESFSISKLVTSIEPQISQSEFNILKNKIGEIKKNHGETIRLIEELRNADVAHQEIGSKSRRVLYEKIEDLFVAVHEILNLLSLHHDKSFTVWDHIPREIEGELTWMFENLERGEKARLKEIEEKYKH